MSEDARDRREEEERQKRAKNAAHLDVMSEGLMSQAMELKRIAAEMRRGLDEERNG